MNSKPSADHGLTKENLVATLPVALQKDPSATALAEAVAELLARRRQEIDRLLIYPAIDRLDERLLDILAYDFKVDWWDANYGLEEKRQTLKDSWRVHKLLGTKTAVETALRAIFPEACAEAWFEYDGGKPYHFRLQIDLTNEKWVEGKPWRALELLRFYQSLRDHMDVIQYTMVLPPATLYTGGGVGIQSKLGIPQEPEEYHFRQTLHAGGAFAVRASLPVPEDPAPPPSVTILRAGGVCTILSNLSKGE